MNKIKKSLLGSISLGLTGITVGTIVAGCAADANDPGNSNSIITATDEPLTEGQKNFHDKRATEIKTQFDANAKLDYNNPSDQTFIDNLLENYYNNLDKGSLDGLVQIIRNLIDNGKISTNAHGLINSSDGGSMLLTVFSSYYDNFRQKNLIPNQNQIQLYKQTFLADDEWKLFAGNIAFFYSDPTNIILMMQIGLKFPAAVLNLPGPKIETLGAFSYIKSSYLEIYNFWSFYKNQPDPYFAAFDAANYYAYFFMNLQTK